MKSLDCKKVIKRQNKNNKDMMSRDFFNTNTIQNFKTFTPQKSQTSINKHFNTTQKLKRVTSCRDTTSRLNPQKFINREVFNSKLYSAKPFNIAVEFNKESQQKIHKLYSFEDNQNVGSIQKKIRKEASQQFSVGMNNLSHYFRTVHQEIESDGNGGGGSIKKQMILLKEGFEKVLRILCKEIQHYEENCVKLMFNKKSEQIRGNVQLKLSGLQDSKLINGRKGLESSRHLLESSRIQNTFLVSNEKSWVKPSTSSSLRQSRVLQQNGSSSNLIKTLTNKLNLTQFESKKQILRIQSLSNEKIQNEGKIKELERRIDEMSEKMGKVNEMEEFYNYKIKKLKEELEVAHIVKEQNLAQKMKYILQNQ